MNQTKPLSDKRTVVNATSSVKELYANSSCCGPSLALPYALSVRCAVSAWVCWLRCWSAATFAIHARCFKGRSKNVPLWAFRLCRLPTCGGLRPSRHTTITYDIVINQSCSVLNTLLLVDGEWPSWFTDSLANNKPNQPHHWVMKQLAVMTSQQYYYYRERSFG